MQGKLIEFKPLMYNGQHSKWNENWKFIVILESNGNTIEGEAMSKLQTGSKSWKVGEMHTFETKDAEQAHAGKNIRSLKVIIQEQAPAGSPSYHNHFDMEKEAYVISRFAHTLSLDYISKAEGEEMEKLKQEFGRELISKFAQSMADSVYLVAKSIIAKDAKVAEAN